MEFFIILLIVGATVGGIILFILLWVISCYNRFVHLKALLNEAWSGIEVQLKRRYDLIPNLIATVKGYSSHEKELFENIAQLRASAMRATSINEKRELETALTSSLKNLMVIVEQYPELKANTNFLHLQNELSGVETELQLSRRYYNGTARNFNSSVASFPSNIIAQKYGFDQVAYFELTHAQERETPKVQF